MNFCDCTQDGYCPRYNREMKGRFREICAGINVDLGTAAAFREQWQREYETIHKFEYMPTFTKPPTPLLLRTDQAPGDALVMTAAIYSLHQSHPGKYVTAVESYWPDVFMHNPDVYEHFIPDKNNDWSDYLTVHMHYPAIHDSNKRGIHFMQGWCEFLGKALDIHVPLITNRPCIYFDKEYDLDDIGDYWLICSGGKNDFTNKLWGFHNYQKLVHLLRDKIKFVQVGGARPIVPWHPGTNGSQNDSHPHLSGVDNMVGKTSLRDLFDLVRRARGVVCGVSLLMHVAAAFNKPAVVIAGGREPVQWNAYPNQQYVHTVGCLPCYTHTGEKGACWRSRVIPQGDNKVLDEHTCIYPVQLNYAGVRITTIPECMYMIYPEHIANLVMMYDRQYEV